MWFCCIISALIVHGRSISAGGEPEGHLLISIQWKMGDKELGGGEILLFFFSLPILLRRRSVWITPFSFLWETWMLPVWRSAVWPIVPSGHACASICIWFCAAKIKKAIMVRIKVCPWSFREACDKNTLCSRWLISSYYTCSERGQTASHFLSFMKILSPSVLFLRYLLSLDNISCF